MALREFYVMDDSGVGIFQYHRQDVKSEVELQLLSGLTRALIDFSSNLLMDDMQSLKLNHGSLIITRDEERLAIGIYDEHDHEVPAKRHNRRLLRAFNVEHEPASMTQELLEFNVSQFNTVKGIPVAIRRDRRITVSFGVIYGLVFSLLMSFGPQAMTEIFQVGISSLEQYALVLGTVTLPCVTLGLLLNTKKGGLLAGAIAALIFAFFIFAVYSQDFNFNTFIYSDILSLMIMVFFFLGGIVGEYIFLGKN